MNLLSLKKRVNNLRKIFCTLVSLVIYFVCIFLYSLYLFPFKWLNSIQEIYVFLAFLYLTNFCFFFLYLLHKLTLNLIHITNYAFFSLTISFDSIQMTRDESNEVSRQIDLNKKNTFTRTPIHSNTTIRDRFTFHIFTLFAYQKQSHSSICVKNIAFFFSLNLLQ